MQAERHRNNHQTEFRERSGRRREKLAQARRPDNRRPVLRGRRQKSAVRDVQTAAVRQGVRVVFHR